MQESGADGVELLIQVTPTLQVRLLQHGDADAVTAAAISDASVDVYAHILWPASLAAARALARVVRRGDTVLDVGAGTGLCALTAALFGAHVTAIDRDAAALQRIARAATSNGTVVRTMQYDIHALGPLPRCTYAVFADLLYETPLAQAVARRVIEVIDQDGMAIVADPGRASRAELDRALASRGVALSWEDVRVQIPGDTPAVVQVATIRS